MKHLLFVFSLLLSAVIGCDAYQANDAAQTVSSDGSFSDTSQALAYVSGKNQNGWILTVGAPGGTYVWTNTLTIGVPGTVTVRGASTNNRPTIVFAGPVHSGIYINASSNLTTLRDFIFNVTATGPAGNVVGIDGTGVCFRVSNCEFLNSSTGIGTSTAFGVQIGSINSLNAPGPYGLVDNCQFFFPGGPVYNYINVMANGNVNHYGWTLPMSWGTVNSVVVENCAFSQPTAVPISGLVEADAGARLTIRYNTITNIPESVHGSQSGAHDSTLQVECYQNKWMLNDTNNTMSYIYLQRGGAGVIWSNIITDTSQWNVSGIFSFWVEGASSQWQSEWYSSQLVYPVNYPAFQQVGRGVVNGAEGPVPVYVWGNKTPGTYYGDFELGMNTDAPFIQQGRDIFTNSVMPGYTPLVYPHPLDLSNGTGSSSSGNTFTNASGVLPPTGLQAHPPAGQ